MVSFWFYPFVREENGFTMIILEYEHPIRTHCCEDSVAAQVEEYLFNVYAQSPTKRIESENLPFWDIGGILIADCEIINVQGIIECYAQHARFLRHLSGLERTGCGHYKIHSASPMGTFIICLSSETYKTLIEHINNNLEKYDAITENCMKKWALRSE